MKYELRKLDEIQRHGLRLLFRGMSGAEVAATLQKSESWISNLRNSRLGREYLDDMHKRLEALVISKISRGYWA